MTGIIARLAIPIEYQPNVEAPFFAVVVVHEGISPEDAERLLPSTAEEPFIQEENIANFPIIQINLTGDVPERMLFNLARDMRDEIEKLGEILSANIDGGREEVMEIVIDPRALETYQISSELLMNSVIRNNRLIPAGSLDTGNGRFSVKVPSIIEDPMDVLAIPVKTVGDTVVTLSDVASVRPTFKERQGYARIDGRNGVALFVVKRSDANILEAIEKTKQVIEQFKSKIPGKITISYSSDQGPYAKSQLVELEGNIVTAMGIVMVIVVAAMGFRNGLIVGLAIPSSFLYALEAISIVCLTASSNLIKEPSLLLTPFFVLTIRASTTCPFLTFPVGIASRTATLITSPIFAYLLFEPPSTLIHITLLAPLLSAIFNSDCICIIMLSPH